MKPLTDDDGQRRTTAYLLSSPGAFGSGELKSMKSVKAHMMTISIKSPLHSFLEGILAHQAPGTLIGKAVVRRRRRLSNDISSKATNPIRPKFYLWLLLAGELKVCGVFLKENWHFSLVAMAP